MRKIIVSAIVLLFGLGQVVASMAADPPKTGEKRNTLIYVRTDPPEATVVVNGKELGKTPGLFPVEAGDATITIELEGHGTVTHAIPDFGAVCGPCCGGQRPLRLRCLATPAWGTAIALGCWPAGGTSFTRRALRQRPL